MEGVPDAGCSPSEDIAADFRPDACTNKGHPGTEQSKEPSIAAAAAPSGAKKPALALKRKGFAVSGCLAPCMPCCTAAQQSVPAPTSALCTGPASCS